MSVDEATAERRKKISAVQNALMCALAGPNKRAVKISLRHLDGLQLTRDETLAVLEHLKMTVFTSAAIWPRSADLLYGWALDLNLAHGWNLEVADHRLSMHGWTTGARPASTQK